MRRQFAGLIAGILFGFGKDIVLLRVICVVRGAGVAQGLIPLNCPVAHSLRCDG
jgi:phage shock protein PspC (stress-responsive transcriptional regulator)